jgi:ABC-2 type transport system ATP-binding protein
VFEGRIDQLGGGTHSRLLVQCADQVKLATALAQRGITDIQALPDGRLAVTGASSTAVGEIALAAGVAIYGIAEQRADLEQRFFELTSGQYQPRASYHPDNPLGMGPAGALPGGAAEWSAAAQPGRSAPRPDTEPAPPNPQPAPPNPLSAGSAPTPESPPADEGEQRT